MIKQLKKLLFFIHRWIGALTSFLFLVWFISGFVMIYHSFPKPISNSNQGLSHISNLDSITDPTPLLVQNKVSALTLKCINNLAMYSIGRRKEALYDASTLIPVDEFSQQECQQIAGQTFSSSIKKEAILNDYDQWIPWVHYNVHFPIYKYWLDDDDKTIAYISSKTGAIVQETTRKSRTMAWLGAIPHWFYFKSLRLDASLWSQVVIWISGFGCAVCLSGIIIGFIRLKRRRKQSVLNISPYKKAYLKWHHLSGLTFGFFVFTFILSGLFSLADVPNWLVKKNDINYRQLWNQSLLNDGDRLLGFQILLSNKKNDDIKSITCKKVMGRTFYELTSNGVVERYTIKDGKAQRLMPLDAFMVESWLHNKLPNCQFDIQTITEYNGKYRARKKGIQPLPVFEVSIHDEFNTQLYIHPQSGQLLHASDNSSQLQWWLYQGLHTFDFGWFSKNETGRKIWLIILSIGGSVVSVTGLLIGIKLIRRKL